MRMIDTRAAGDRELRRTMVSADETLGQAKKTLEVDSNIRMYVAADDAMAKFLWSREAINEPQTQTMELSVGNFVRDFKRAHWLPNQKPHKLSGPSIPPELVSPAVCAAPTQCPKKITQAFDRSDYYESTPKPLAEKLPEIEMTRRFRSFIEKMGDRIPQMFGDVTVEEPSAPRLASARRRRPRPPLYVK
jgi:hypothetical protein